MTKNMTNMNFLMIMMISTMMVLSSNNIMFSWMSMEINFIAFLPMLNKSKKINDQTMKYLIIQSTSSSLMLMSILTNSYLNWNMENSLLLMTSMMMKMGMMPFHMWMPNMMQMMSWENCIIFSTWQKIAPMILISQMIKMNTIMPIMCLNLLMSPMTGLKQTSMKKIMAYSSISNSPWMITATKSSKLQSLYFFMTYSMLTFAAMNLFKKNNLMFLNQLKQLNHMQKMVMLMTILSMSGMPPLLGFFPKWMVIQSMTTMSIQMSMSMIISSMLSTFMYMKMIYPTMTNFFTSKKTKIKQKTTLMHISLNLMGIPSMMILKMN
uniref:NADH-ubiquinone oxidoreductase chain 2 n=1 Tax=Plectoderini sp. SX-2018 TaxID=2507541 RepID=A0A565D7C1_9HEMI|nr:NADH dehydrogenase subunit 2 [Plectoderini sp. SX-2018]